MSDHVPEPVDRQADVQELVNLAGLPCTRSVEDAFRRHFPMGFLEAMVVLQKWTAISDLSRQGAILGGPGSISTPDRTDAWEQDGDSVIVTVTNQYEPKTYSLE